VSVSLALAGAVKRASMVTRWNDVPDKTNALVARPSLSVTMRSGMLGTPHVAVMVL